MLKRAMLIGIAGACAATALVFAAAASPAAGTSTATAPQSCSNAIQIGILGPFTGPVASIGTDQLHWAQFFATTWNKTHKLQITIVQGDTQLDPAKASVVAQSFSSNPSILATIGPAGSQEVTAVAPILKKAGLAFMSGSATNVALTNGKLRGYFFRVVPNDGVQAPTAASYMMKKLGVGKGSTVMIVDDQESYSTGLAGIVGNVLKKGGVTVDRESISQKTTDFSSLVAKVTGSTKVVFLPFQVASQAQLFAQQLKAQGKSAVVFGSDGTFDSKKFNVSGNYVSFFAPDVTTIAADRAITAAYNKAYPGGTSPFGAPNYVAAQMYATAATSACKDGKISRDELRLAVAKVKLGSTILGGPMAFTANGDVAGAKFFVFKIVGGKYTAAP
ncbi:MAG: branched-chain amino acid transport system substrate-binding protein [Thermoleophilaceae bacterium]|nr:branched-chain amino acid transport system substrate-binding protein [Thermoleophilaceae bacterium]